MALTTRVWGAGKVLMLLALLAGTFLVSFLVAMRVAIKTRDVAVPALAGRSVIEDARRLDPDVPAGRVAAQDPAAGRTTRRQRSVKVWLSGGPASTIVPALVGESERTAQIRLQATALALSGLAEIRSAEYAAGVVIAQTPAADTRAPAVALLLNRGEAGVTYVMPDLIGARGDRAADLMRARGFRVSVVGDHPYPGLPPGTVIRQRPRGGFQVAPGDPISLEVSR
jgi:beta-lactam-binding protein with PASTA domain